MTLGVARAVMTCLIACAPALPGAGGPLWEAPGGSGQDIEARGRFCSGASGREAALEILWRSPSDWMARATFTDGAFSLGRSEGVAWQRIDGSVPASVALLRPALASLWLHARSSDRSRGFEMEVDGSTITIGHPGNAHLVLDHVHAVPAASTLLQPAPGFQAGPECDDFHAPILVWKEGLMLPMRAKRPKVSGCALIAARLDSSGSVVAAELLSSGHEALDGAALYAVRRWRFLPAQCNGRPIAIDWLVEVAVPSDDREDEVWGRVVEEIFVRLPSIGEPEF